MNMKTRRYEWKYDWIDSSEKSVRIKQIVPGPFSSPKLIKPSALIVYTSPSKNSQSEDEIEIRKGIPNIFHEYLTLKGLIGDQSVRRKLMEQYKFGLNNKNMKLMNDLWKKYGLNMDQGIPDPMKSYPDNSKSYSEININRLMKPDKSKTSGVIFINSNNINNRNEKLDYNERNILIDDKNTPDQTVLTANKNYSIESDRLNQTEYSSSCRADDCYYFRLENHLETSKLSKLLKRLTEDEANDFIFFRFGKLFDKNCAKSFNSDKDEVNFNKRRRRRRRETSKLSDDKSTNNSEGLVNIGSGNSKPGEASRRLKHHINDCFCDKPSASASSSSSSLYKFNSNDCYQSLSNNYVSTANAMNKSSKVNEELDDLSIESINSDDKLFESCISNNFNNNVNINNELRRGLESVKCQPNLSTTNLLHSNIYSNELDPITEEISLESIERKQI